MIANKLKPNYYYEIEIVGLSMALLQLFFRVIIMRRMFSLVGTVFLLRCVTMMITSLSVPGVHLECQAKFLFCTSSFFHLLQPSVVLVAYVESYGSLVDKLIQAFHIWSHLGLSIQGVRTCGDYMFSGHTTAITLLNHLITEYTPPSWTFLHTTTWVLNLFGVFFILAGHEHYSIDVFIAFYISSRMFLYYHAYAYNHANLTATDDRIRLWFPLGWFFEAGSMGKVPNEFEMPLRLIMPRWLNGHHHHHHEQHHDEEEKEKKDENRHEKEGKHGKRSKKKTH
ncbi:unnamed protein product [Cylicostephanus goldi]|uniref:Sphingomyelin synthase-like domain-containing protein n=1 Tax=Cylicostephanus goldi TaxID=71465 RepID=A0A3P6QFI4_CYLGO|nr:unnamed protein product [Cylicostephanus goldi]